MDIWKRQKQLEKILTKSFLIQEYIKNKKSTPQIAREIGCGQMTIWNYLNKFNIPRRTTSESIKECFKKYPERCRGYIDGRTLKEHYYCKEPDCKNEIGIISALYGKGRCVFCANKGENNPSYFDGKGYEPYTPEFTRRLKEKIRKRDNYQCQNCGMTQEEHFIVYGRDIEIHHIDHNRKNCNDDNLITVCKQCNIRANYNRDYWREYFLKKEGIDGKKRK